MPTKVTIAQLKSHMAGDLDAYAFELLTPDSCARHGYDTKPYPEIRGAHCAANADGDECKSCDLTPKEWAEEMDAARIALAHDMKLDLIRKGITSYI